MRIRHEADVVLERAKERRYGLDKDFLDARARARVERGEGRIREDGAGVGTDDEGCAIVMLERGQDPRLQAAGALSQCCSHGRHGFSVRSQLRGLRRKAAMLCSDAWRITHARERVRRQQQQHRIGQLEGSLHPLAPLFRAPVVEASPTAFGHFRAPVVEAADILACNTKTLRVVRC